MSPPILQRARWDYDVQVGEVLAHVTEGSSSTQADADYSWTPAEARAHARRLLALADAAEALGEVDPAGVGKRWPA